MKITAAVVTMGLEEGPSMWGKGKRGRGRAVGVRGGRGGSGRGGGKGPEVEETVVWG